jgi:hypothetical protein
MVLDDRESSVGRTTSSGCPVWLSPKSASSKSAMPKSSSVSVCDAVISQDEECGELVASKTYYDCCRQLCAEFLHFASPLF